MSSQRIPIETGDLTIASIAVSAFKSELIDSIAAHLSSAHHLSGYFEASPEPMLAFSVPSRVGHDNFQLKVESFLGSFGASLQFTLEYPSNPTIHSRVFLTREQSMSPVLTAGQLKAAIFHGARLQGIFSLAFKPSALQCILAEIESIRDSKAKFFEDENLHYYQRLALDQRHASHLTKRDRLSIGWYRRAFGACNWLAGFLNRAREESSGVSRTALDGLPSSLQATLQAMAQTDYSCSGLMSYFQDVIGGDTPRLFAYSKDIHESRWAKRADVSNSVRSALLWAVDLQLQSAATTECGQFLLWLNPERAQFSRLRIEPDSFPREANPEDYWPRIRRGLHIGYGLILDGSDFPVDQIEVRAASQEFPQADDPEAVMLSAYALLDEAVSSKQSIVPPGAVIELKLGPFSQLDITERGDGLWCAFRRADGRFMHAFVVPKEHHVFFELPYPDKYCWGDETYATVEFETIQRIESAAKLLLCAVIRDFWVVENRESVFASRSSGMVGGREDVRRPRVVYLPRIRYTKPPDVSNCSNQLAQVERAKQFVRAHLRRAEHASDTQLFLAQRYGFEVPTGYTFVRPYEKGQKEREVLFRSRSALQCLFEVDQSVDSGHSRWFQFERDVRRLMEKFGFDVQHIAASGKGDHGVDLYATKGVDLDVVNFVIQCKCWKPNRPVTPAVVRELEGVLSGYPQGTRGMIVTTSRFSPGAVEQARLAGVRLIDGTEFVSMLGEADSGFKAET